MKTFCVYVPEIWRKCIIVEAEDEQKAIEVASLKPEAFCKSNYNPYEKSWFAETMSKDFWTAEEKGQQKPGHE